MNRRHRSPARLLAIALLAVLLAVSACTTSRNGKGAGSASPSSSGGDGGGLAGGDGEDPSPSTAPRSTILTTPRPSLSAGEAREIDAPCPYISNADWASGEGNRVGRSVQLATKPVGCRFYFQYDENQITGEITMARFETATQAFNAVVTAAQGHPEFVDDKDIGDGGSISRRMPLQATATWECVFSKGTLVVTVHTSQANISDNARSLAREIAPKVH